MNEPLIFEGFLCEATIDGEGRKTETVRNVLLCGLESLNGRSIPASAFGDARRLYEGVHVYLNHDMEAGPSRKVQELAGVVENVRTDNLGRPRGDIRINENKAGDELRSLVKFAQSAEKHGAKLKNVGMSHVARYTFAGRDRTQVESVDEVFSVDVVIRPATTKSFHESHHAVPETFDVKEFLESMPPVGRPFDSNPDPESDRAVAEALASLSGPSSADAKDNTFDSSKALESLTFTH